jgi:heptaprenyl diphosphate synthase
MSARISHWGALRYPGLKKDIDSKLLAVENVLHEATKSHLPELQVPAQHLSKVGGKNIRPVMTILASHFGDPHSQKVIHAAAAVELLHLASLHHDDVIDEATLRRGVPSVNARWGNLMAVRSGNFLLARSAAIVADLGAEVINAHHGLMHRLIRGQAKELAGPAAESDPLEHYFEVIADKTGVLIAGAARIGALVAGADPASVDAVGAFGERIGVAFQIGDDILDITSTDGEFGKVPGTDLRRGVQTLPLLILHSSEPDSADPADTRLRSLLAGTLRSDEQIEEALTLLRGHPALEEACVRLGQLISEALAHLRLLRRGPARSAMEDLCRSVLSRV